MTSREIKMQGCIARLLVYILSPLMRRIEEIMIRRLLRQRDEARARIDAYRRAAGMKLGEFLEGGEEG